MREDTSLGDYTTMKVGGVADYFYVAQNIDELVKAILIAKELGIKYFIIGGGSNILVSDNGYRGLIILNRAKNLAFLADKSQVIADSGVALSRLIMEAADHDMGGMEGLFGIPGTIGGAVYGNVGAHGVEVSQFIKSVTLLSVQGKIIRCKIDSLKPKYRSSYLKDQKKKNNDSPIVLSVKFQFSPNKKEEVVKKLSYYQNIRMEKQPYNELSCGSVFRNTTLINTNTNTNSHELIFGKELTAGYLLDQAGAKKLCEGGMKVSHKHANFIVNNGKGKAIEVRNLIEKMRQKVAEKDGVVLEEEIEYVGEWK
ncbi:MAG: UDP-N-acetylenolpyruvoylglucosamine reductase [uncultured bacterium]|nr:MAG: UDP-N-acetylenolpyruvoylglucosamine reductase [uncultured bacterium]